MLRDTSQKRMKSGASEEKVVYGGSIEPAQMSEGGQMGGTTRMN